MLTRAFSIHWGLETHGNRTPLLCATCWKVGGTEKNRWIDSGFISWLGRGVCNFGWQPLGHGEKYMVVCQSMLITNTLLALQFRIHGFRNKWIPKATKLWFLLRNGANYTSLSSESCWDLWLAKLKEHGASFEKKTTRGERKKEMSLTGDDALCCELVGSH